MSIVSGTTVIKHKVYTDEYVGYLRHQARSRVLAGLNLDALDSCGASLGQTEDEIEHTRASWEERARRAELDFADGTVQRQQEGLQLLLARGAQLETTTVEPCTPSERQKIVASGFGNPPEQKFTVYHLRV